MTRLRDTLAVSIALLVIIGLFHVFSDPEPVSLPDTATVDLAGLATWYRTPGLTAAAGPALRRWLGDWRGQHVRVCAESCVVVELTDWCACGERGGRPTVIDLSDAAFAELAPLAAGVLEVRVSAIVPPRTDAR